MVPSSTGSGSGSGTAGLCSVTLRALPAADVVAVAVRAGLTAIEWGADVHARPDDMTGVAAVAEATAAAGLRVASYGSYLRMDEEPAEQEAVLAAAVALGAPRIRAWAGRHGSGDTDVEGRRAIVAGLRAFAARAADAGVLVGLEFHGGTLTDTVESTLQLLADTDHPAVGTYWQPPQGAPDDEALAGLAAVAPHVLAVHAFSWWPRAERHPLATRSRLWHQVAAWVAGRDRPTDVLLEFVPEDAPDAVVRDAAVLRGYLGISPGVAAGRRSP